MRFKHVTPPNLPLVRGGTATNYKFYPMKILALDYGKKRIGYAVGEMSLGIAFGRDVILNESFDSTLKAIREIISEESIEMILIGLPKLLDGKETEQTVYTRKFAEKLRNSLGMKVEMEDERLTSSEATKSLHLQEIKEKKQKGKKDVISAEIILQNYLDRQ